MAGDLATTATNFYFTHFRKTANSDIPRASDMAKMLFSRAKRIRLGGTSLATQWSHELGEGVGSSVGTEAGDYPTPGFDSAINPSLSATTLLFSVGWSYHLLNAGTDTRYDTKDVIKKKGKALSNDAKKMVARYLAWNGDDVLFQIGAASGTTDGYITIKDATFPIHMIEAGQTLTVRDNTTGGTEQLTNAATGGGRVTSVDTDLGRIYLADVTGAAADDYVSFSGHYDKVVPNGIRNLIDSTATVQGITRTAAAGVPWRCIEIDRAGASLTASDWDELRDRVMDQSYLRSGNFETTVVGNRKMRRWLIDVSRGQVRFASLADIGIGANKITLQGADGKKVMLEDEYLLDGELWAPTWDKFVLGTPSGTDDNGMQPVKNGSSSFFQATAASGQGYADQQFQYLRCVLNLGIDDGRCHGKMTGIAAPV